VLSALSTTGAGAQEPVAPLPSHPVATAFAQVALPPVSARPPAILQGEGDGTPERRTFARLPLNLVRGAVGVFHLENLRPALVGMSVSGGATVFIDEAVREAVSDPDNQIGQSLESWGSPSLAGGIVAGLFLVTRATGPSRFRDVTYDWLTAHLVTGAYTALLKQAVGRRRPNGQNANSFPSGHASNAFALAAVAERHYGWKVGIPAYGLASAVALSRLQRDMHYLADVTAGATLGYIVGRSVVRMNGGPTPAAKRRQVIVTPVVGRGTRAIVVQAAWN
jgi:hypothetical protein